MHTLRSYGLLVEWQTLRLQSFLPLAIVVQVMFAFGIVVGYPLLFPELDEMTVLFLATGAPAITLITMGLVALPQVVAQGKHGRHARVHAQPAGAADGLPHG